MGEQKGKQLLEAVGVPKEVKASEGRVGLTPECVRKLRDVTKGKVAVLVERGAGEMAGYADLMYELAGATISDVDTVFARSGIIVKVKEPITSEYERLRKLRGRILYTYLHLSGVDPKLTELLLKHRVTGVAYECVEVDDAQGHRSFPLLAPMSDIAGRQAMRAALEFVSRKKRIEDIKTVIIGYGVVGEAALKEAFRWNVHHNTVFEKDQTKSHFVEMQFGPYDWAHGEDSAKLICAKGQKILSEADIVLSGVLIPGAHAPKVLSGELLALLKPGAYVADVAIDQGGSTEWSKVTPPGTTLEMNGVTLSCVPNIPGSTVPQEATCALTDATYPYLEKMVLALLRRGGFKELIRHNDALRHGLQTYRGQLMNASVAKDLGLEEFYRDPNILFK